MNRTFRPTVARATFGPDTRPRHTDAAAPHRVPGSGRAMLTGSHDPAPTRPNPFRAPPEPRPMPLLYPSIDLRGGRVVRLVQGDYARQLDYAADPAALAAEWHAAGAEWLHVVDLDGAKAGRVAQAAQVAQIAGAAPLKVQAGGGVRSADDVDRLLGAGAARVVVGTKAVRDWPWFMDQVARRGPNLTLAVDARDGVVATEAWQSGSDVTAAELAERTAGTGLGAILYTDVARDGMLGGSDVAGTVGLAGATDVPVIASGGIGSAADVAAFAGTPVHGVIVGRALHDGRLTIRAALAALGA